MDYEQWLTDLKNILLDRVPKAESESAPLGSEENPIPLVLAKDELEDVCDAGTEVKPTTAKQTFRDRLKAAGKHLLHLTGSLVGRAVVLALALLIVATIKGCGLPVK